MQQEPCFVFYPFVSAFGGIERLIVDLACFLNGRGQDLTLIAFQNAVDFAQYGAERLKIQTLPCHRSLRSEVSALRSFTRQHEIRSSQILAMEMRGAMALKNNLHHAKLRVEAAQQHLRAADWRAPLAVSEARLQVSQQRLERAMQAKLERKWHQLSLTSGKLEMLSPLAVLSRGYAIVRDEVGQLIPNGADLQRGQKITVRFEDGDVGCQVIKPLK